LARTLGQHPDSALACSLKLREAVVAVGAPVPAYMPRAAAHLKTQATIPRHADVANAVGAVVNGVVQRLKVLIRPRDTAFRVHLPDGVRDFLDLDAGVAHAREAVTQFLRAQARQAGAAHTDIRMTRNDRTAPDGYGGDGRIFVEAELEFVAVGGPGLHCRQAPDETPAAAGKEREDDAA
jgi:N-methylhydantoinase A/oxoprolinase/acetone carboxylase beta subunit